MKYIYQIQGLTNSGKPAIYVNCEHCKIINFNLQAHIYSTNLQADPRVDIDTACSDFFEKLNNGDYSMFLLKKTARKVERSLCHCDPKIVDIEYLRSVSRAKAILKAGLEQIKR